MPRGQKQFFLQAVNIVVKQQRPFSKADFPRISSANYRKYIQKIKKHLVLVCNSRPKFWTIKGVELPGDSHRVTLYPTGVGQEFYDILESLKLENPAIHDIKIQFESDLHKCLVTMGLSVNPSNHLIKVEYPILDNNVNIKILVYPDTTQIDIGCTYKPIVYNFQGILYLTEILSKISGYLSRYAKCMTIPPVYSWIMTHYHFGKDGREINGQTFHVTVEDAASGLIRFYSKRMPGGAIIPRIEQIKTLKQTLEQKLQEVLETPSQ
jgi:hypothetical protein